MKSVNCLPFRCYWSRSREGAWIEMICTGLYLLISVSRSRKGAWIEIAKELKRMDLENERRSRKGAWIEILISSISS